MGHAVEAEITEPSDPRPIDPASGKAYAAYERTFRTNVAQSDLPDKPLIVGPHYTVNPEVDFLNKPPARAN